MVHLLQGKAQELSPQLLPEEHAPLDLINKYKLQLSSAMSKECLIKDSGLRKEIENIRFSDDEQINKNLLQMVILFYEQNVLNQHRDFLKNQVFVKTMSGLLLNSVQMNLIPFLLRNRYDSALFQLVLSEEAYYSSVQTLIQLGYTDDIPSFFALPDKCKELVYIHSLEDINTQKLCLIFWAKGELTLKEYKKIVKETIDYPLLADTLVNLDQTDKIPIQSLVELALEPLHHQRESILYHFAPQLRQVGMKKVNLMQLDVNELTDLSKSFSVLQKAGVTASDSYVLALKNNKQGQLLRLFLPSLDKISNTAHQKALINILYTGKAIIEITDNDLSILAKNLHERFICAKQMQDLHCSKEIITLAAEEWGIQGIRFRKIILRVEEHCKMVHEKIRGSLADKDKARQWQNADKDYRRTMYNIAYDGLTKSDSDIRTLINQSEKKVLDIVDPELTSWLYTALIVIANIVISILTVGIANNIKHRNTGNCWFFNQTQLGEKVRALNKEVLDVIESPKPDPALS